MFVQRFDVVMTADGTGNGTAFTPTINGQLSQIRYTKPNSGGFINGAAIVMTAEQTGEAIWSESGVNSSATRAPRMATHGTDGSLSVFSGTLQVQDKIALANDRIKITVGTAGTLGNIGTFSFLVV
jgi:hypothetical protein